MESYLTPAHFDLVTPDGFITKVESIDSTHVQVELLILDISTQFKGFELDKNLVKFNLKSTLAQIGLNTQKEQIILDRKRQRGEVYLEIEALGPFAEAILPLLETGLYLGKLFAKDPRRRVRDPYYLQRMFGRSDREGRALLSLGGRYGSNDFVLEKIENATIAFISLKKGTISYDTSIYGFLPTLVKALSNKNFSTRPLLQLHQIWQEGAARIVQKKRILLVKTPPLHIRTVYAQVAGQFLPKGFHHTTANVLEPDTLDSGDIYELYGMSHHELDNIPLEFYTLEPHREHVFFEDRDQLQVYLEDPKVLFQTFATIPTSKDIPSAVFIVKGEQLKNLSPSDWIQKDPHKHSFPGISHPSRQGVIVEKYIEKQPSYPFLRAIEKELITSQGVLFCNYFPSPLMKRLFLSDFVQKFLKGIYFAKPSYTHDYYFSHEDRSFLLDLAKFGIPVFWVDSVSNKVLQYVVKPEKDAGMFIPYEMTEQFRKATIFGVYGSNLRTGPHEQELKMLFTYLLSMRDEMAHPLLYHNIPLALVTGGGPGVMEMGNRIAKQLGIISCANIVDFRTSERNITHEQNINKYIDAKMTYRLDHLVERQAEFHLDFPIFLLGGMGTDFEYSLEEVRRKTYSTPPTPIILFGLPEYWEAKISSRFHCNKIHGTIKDSEWISNCMYCVQTGKQAAWVYRNFFQETLPIGENGPIYEKGFYVVPKDV